MEVKRFVFLGFLQVVALGSGVQECLAVIGGVSRGVSGFWMVRIFFFFFGGGGGGLRGFGLRAQRKEGSRNKNAQANQTDIRDACSRNQKGQLHK